MEQIINSTNQNNSQPNACRNSDPVLKKSVSPFLIIFFIVLFSSGAFFLGQYLEKNKNSVYKNKPTQLTTIPTIIPTINPISNWKIYINNDFSYSVKYPIDNYVRVICPGGELILAIKQGIEDTYETEVCPDGETSLNISSQTKEIILPPLGSATTSFEVKSVVTAIESKDILVDKLAAKEYKITYNTPDIDHDYTNTWVVFSHKGRNFKIVAGDKTLLYQILSTFKFLEASSDTITSTQTNGAKLTEIKYTLPQSWNVKLSNDNLIISPANGGGYFSIRAVNYPGNIGRREYYCQISKVCIEGTSRFTETKIGNISGYKADALDNSGGGLEYFGAKGNMFYIISTFSPPLPNEFDKNYQKVLNSLIF